MRPLTAAVELLLEARRPDAARSLSTREKRVDGVAAAGFVLAALVLAAIGTEGTTVPVGQLVALVASYALLARVRFAVGSGFTMPTQLAFVPILLLLPPALTPALVGGALVLARAPELILRRAPAERLLSAIADGWYVVAPALLLTLLAPQGAIEHTGLAVWVAALGLQISGDLVASTLRESLGAGVSPALQAGVIGEIAVTDVLLSAVGLLAALGSQVHPYAFLLTLPLVGGLSLVSRERAARIARALELVDELDRERARVISAQRRIGETAAANLDREALKRIIVTTAIELVEADAGRLSVRECADGPLLARARGGRESGLADVLSAVESALARRGGLVEANDAGARAIGVSLDGGDSSLRVLAVARRNRDFTERERELMRTFAEQAAVCLKNIALHERVQRLAATDDLTGLLNHRRLQEVLDREVRRASRYGSPLALVMLDIDDFKQVNDEHGHQQGDRMLRTVADVIRASVREVDMPARYGGEEFAVALPEMDLDGAAVLAERMRAAIGAAEITGRDGVRLAVTTSIGVAALDLEAPARTELIAAADAALYRAKRGGKNRVELAREGVRVL